MRRPGHAFLAAATALALTANAGPRPQTGQQRAQAACEAMPAAHTFEKESAEQKAELERINGPGTNHTLAQELMRMRSADQDIRERMFGGAAANEKKLLSEMDKIDAQSTARLKEIVAQYGWPTIALVGVDASQAALLLLIHSPDHAFQRDLIPQLERLVEEKKIIGSDVAVLIDKELRAEGKPQRFGSQFSRTDNGAMSMDPVEDPAHLEERRRMFLLPPMDFYKCLMSESYNRTIR